ncbi:MAG: eCIS core domain-containing protein, partial [Acidimicrobiales bacterium]
TELDSYDMVSADVARRVRVVRVPFLPGGYAGMTLGRTVLLANPVAADGNSALLAHELVHVRQWNELGVVGFSGRYLGSFARNLVKHRGWNRAYNNIGAEVEAKRETTDWLRRRTRDAL